MPVQPDPLEICCPKCGWQHVWQPASDALTITELPPACCPRCHHADLQAKPASTASALWGQVKQWLPSA